MPERSLNATCGADQLSTVAGASACSTTWARSSWPANKFNLVEYAQAGSLMVRIAARLGIYPSAARGRRAASND